MKTADQTEKKELSNMEAEIKKILALYDSKKNIIIPKVEKLEKNLNSNTNDNKIAVPSNKKDFTHRVKYDQKEFARPDCYWLYSEKNRKDSHMKEYEATHHDVTFLNFENNFMSLVDLEKIITMLENDIGKGEQIPVERAKEIIISNFPEQASNATKISKFFFTRREDFKKSWLRKYWKEQKSTDKILAETFRRREKEKMKTRRYPLKDFETLDRLKEIKKSTWSLQNITASLKQREELKDHLLLVNNFAFESEACILRGEKIPSESEDKWKLEMKEISKLQVINDEKEKKSKSMDNSYNNESTSPQSNNGKSTKENGIASNIGNNQRDSLLIQNENSRQSNRYHQKIKKIKNDKKTQNSDYISQQNHNIIRLGQNDATRHIAKKKEDSYSKSPFDITLNDWKDICDRDEDEAVLKLRFRSNRGNKIVIDRYIQKKNSFNPFDDSFAKNYMKLQMLNRDYVYQDEQEGNFDNLYNQYLKTVINDTPLYDDTDDENNFQNQMRSFQNSHKQFLKQKRGHN